MTDRPLLFCVPHAGGSARAFRGWQRVFGDRAEVVAPDLAGRGTRAAESPPASVRAAAVDLLGTVLRRARDRPYALFGHSMGSLVAYEAAVAAREASLPQPRLVVVSGRNPPQHPADWSVDVLGLPDAELLAALRAVGGVPAGLSPAIATALFLPRLRADLAMALSYDPGSPPRRTGAPLLVVSGRADPLVRPDADAGWARCTDAGCTVLRHDGHLFSLFSRVGELADAGGTSLGRPVPAASGGGRR
jgi:surfactin synthase thioesterase subunit